MSQRLSLTSLLALSSSCSVNLTFYQIVEIGIGIDPQTSPIVGRFINRNIENLKHFKIT